MEPSASANVGNVGNVVAAIKRGWSDDAFMRSQGLHVDERAIGEVTLCLPQASAAQRGGGAGGDAAKVLNGGVIASKCSTVA